MIITYHW